MYRAGHHVQVVYGYATYPRRGVDINVPKVLQVGLLHLRPSSAQVLRQACLCCLRLTVPWPAPVER